MNIIDYLLRTFSCLLVYIILEYSVKRYIDSGDEKRLSGDESNFTYQLSLPLLPFDRVCITEALIPISYYLIDNNHNFMILDEDGAQVTITVPVGNYSVNSFINIVTALMTTASPNGYRYSGTYPNSFLEPQTGKITFTVTDNGIIQPSFIFTNHLCVQFGFNIHTTNTFSNNTLVSTNCVSFVPTPTVYIHSDIVSPDHFNDSNVLGVLDSANSIPMQNLVFHSTQIDMDSVTFNSSKNSSIFSFTICNADGEIIDLNGLPVRFKLLVYKKANIMNLLSKFFQYQILKDEEDRRKLQLQLEQQNNESNLEEQNNIIN